MLLHAAEEVLGVVVGGQDLLVEDDADPDRALLGLVQEVDGALASIAAAAPEWWVGHAVRPAR